jgi:SOS-response transcriptional repressor LexA
MPTDHRATLASIKRFDQLIAYLRDEMGWPIARDSFEDVDDLFYDFTADELGIDPKTAAKIESIKRLRPLSTRQPWGIFFVKFEPKKLPVVALRRILSQVALKKRASANSAERTAWAADDLLFVSNYGEGDERQITFAHFSKAPDGHDLPTLKVLGWNNRDTLLHLDAVAGELTQRLAWPDDDADVEAWRQGWRGAFTLRHGEVVTTSKELSIRLAKLARDIRDRIKSALGIETDRGLLTKLMKAFQASLVHDLDADGFADMYAQTIAYGLLSARIANPHKKTVDDFAGHMRTNPFLRELMETFLKVGGRRGKAGGPGIDFDELGVSEVVELLDHANMEAVVRDFGDKNPQEDPVIHFYELFLKEYDAKKRMQRGVFYTPRPVVSYIVRSVDELLRTEFGLEDGLADTTTWGEMAKRHKDLKIPEGTHPTKAFVQILDPATGTGTFLVEVIDIIHKTMVAKWTAQRQGEKKIEALWNEYVPKHLLPRLHAYELLMAPYAIAHLKVGLKLYETGYRFGTEERARIYLTNALEPWVKQLPLVGFDALAHEATAVNAIKREKWFTVIVGNPPYSKASQNLGEQFLNLIERFRIFSGERIHEPGAILFERDINNDYVKFFGLNRNLIELVQAGVLGIITSNSYLDGKNFRGVRDALTASFNKLSVLNLHGDSRSGALARQGIDDENVFDIETGVCILFATRTASATRCTEIEYSETVGTYEQKAALLLDHDPCLRGKFSPIDPRRYKSFIPSESSVLDEYAAFRRLDEAYGLAVDGIKTSRDGLVIANTASECALKIQTFINFLGGAEELEQKFGISVAKWDYKAAQKHLRRHYSEKRIFRLAYRPLDFRWIYYDSELVFSHRAAKMSHLIRGGNLALVCASRLSAKGFNHVLPADCLVEMKYASHDTNSRVFPALLYEDSLLSSNPQPNTGKAALQIRGGLADSSDWTEFNEAVLAVLNSTKYRARYVEEIKNDFPGVPSMANPGLRRDLARLGQRLICAQLLRAEVPKTAFPFSGRFGEEIGTPELDGNRLRLSDSAYFFGVGPEIFEFNLAGYQVCKNWVSAGNKSGIQRKGTPLTREGAQSYRQVLFAIQETIKLRALIDEVIEQHGGWPGAFQTGEAQSAGPNVIPFRPRIVQPGPKERYVDCVPLVPLKAAAGAFGDPQHIDEDCFEWAAVETKHRLRPGMFVAQVVGKSMEPAIPDGSHCLFAAPVTGTRQGKTVLVQLRDATDPDSGERYTIKRYESEKAQEGDSWRHEKITLKPVNPDFKPIVITGADEGQLQVVAEFVEVLGGGS